MYTYVAINRPIGHSAEPLPLLKSVRKRKPLRPFLNGPVLGPRPQRLPHPRIHDPVKPNKRKKTVYGSGADNGPIGPCLLPRQRLLPKPYNLLVRYSSSRGLPSPSPVFVLYCRENHRHCCSDTAQAKSNLAIKYEKKILIYQRGASWKGLAI